MTRQEFLARFQEHDVLGRMEEKPWGFLLIGGVGYTEAVVEYDDGSVMHYQEVGDDFDPKDTDLRGQDYLSLEHLQDSLNGAMRSELP